MSQSHSEMALATPIGAIVQSDGRVLFRVWAPRRRTVAVVLEPDGRSMRLEPQDGGYFAGLIDANPGDCYRFRLDEDATPYPDPAARYQPDGPHGVSEIIDPTSFSWTDQDWPGVSLPGQVLYELHIGTFTPEGTWIAAAEKLPLLREVGITVIEVMPVADFPGRFGWGYDGVHLFAPTRLYGRPDDFRAFVNRAHSLGIGVILDVVYNHLGPDGNYLAQFSSDYFTSRYHTDWGSAINFDGPNCRPVREFFCANAAHWISEYHLDGLRLDATQNIYDSSDRHILVDLAVATRRAAGRRSVILVSENESQDVRQVRPIEQGGFGLDAIWNDDFHHSAAVALTGRAEAYYSDYRGGAAEFVAAAKYGFLYQGQRYEWQKKRRGTPTYGVPPASFVTFLENHDQIANSGRGLRKTALASPGRCRALTALMLLGPGTPMLFQGQEFAASAPFLFFADHEPRLAKLVSQGRAAFLSQFPSVAEPAMRKLLDDPANPESFKRCRLDWSERDRNSSVVALHRDLLHLRRSDSAFRAQRPGGVDGAVLSCESFVLRFFGLPAGGADDRLLIVNLGRDLHLRPAPQPLLAPPLLSRWVVQWSSEDPRYDGGGTPEVDSDDDNWRIPGHAAIVLRPVHASEARR